MPRARLGERAQAPALVMLADLAAARDPAAAHAAADALAASGEPYTAARSLAAVLARLGAPEAASPTASTRWARAPAPR